MYPRWTGDAGGADCYWDLGVTRAMSRLGACDFLRCSYFRYMPIYEFHCEKCGKDSEVLVRSSDWKGTECPKCGSTKLEKKFSVFASSNAEGGASPSPKRSGGGCGPGCGCH